MRERTLALLAATLISICDLGRADFKYTQSGQLAGAMASMAKNSRSPQTVVTTTSVKGSYLRIDLPDGSYGIIDLNDGRELQLDPKNRTYSVITFGEIRARNEAEQQESRAKGRDQPAPQFQHENAGAKGTAQVEVALTGRTQILLGQTAQESEILIKVLTRLSSFDGRSSFRTWLYRIVVNHVPNSRVLSLTAILVIPSIPNPETMSPQLNGLFVWLQSYERL